MDKVCRNFISYSFVWAARRLHIFHLPFSFLRVVDVPFPTHSDFWSKCFPKQILIPVANLTVIISLIRISSCFVCIELLSEQLEKGWKKKSDRKKKKQKLLYMKWLRRLFNTPRHHGWRDDDDEDDSDDDDDDVLNYPRCIAHPSLFQYSNLLSRRNKLCSGYMQLCACVCSCACTHWLFTKASFNTV